MTAKALAALTPLTDVPATAIHLSTTLLQALVVNRKIRTGGSGSGGGSAGTVIDDDRATTTTGTASGDDITNSSTIITGHNEMHGLLTLIAEPLATLNRRLVGLKLLDNHVFYTQRKTEISEGLLPILAALLSELSAVSCPPIHYVFIRILRTVVSLLTEGGGSAGGSGVGSVGGEGEVAVALLLGECRVSLQPILQSLDTTMVKGVSVGVSEGVTKGVPEGVLMGALPPYAPTVYREALSDLVYYSLLAATSTETPSDTSTTTTTTTTTTTNTAASNPSPTSDHTSNASSPFSPYPINTSLWSLLHHPMSELREGMLLGCLRALSSEISVNGGVDDVTYTSVAHLLCEREEVMSMLLSRLNVETEPPIRILTLHLLCDLTRRRPLREMKFSRIQSTSPHQPFLQPSHQTNTYDLFTSTATWQLLMSLATASTQGLGKVLGVSLKHTDEPLANNDASVRALEVMGWIIGGGRRGVKKSTSSGETSGETSRVQGW